jgi:hypothetical protein
MAKEVEQHSFAQFLAMTKRERENVFGFSTQKEFSEKFNVSEKTLSQWRKDPRFKKLRREMFLEIADDRLPDVIQSLLTRAIDDGDVSAAKELVKMGGLSVDKMEIVSSSDIQTLLVEIIDIITEHVKDPTILNLIAADLERISEKL